MKPTMFNRQQTLLMTTNEVKTLYHFTSKWAASKIVTQGLKANWVSNLPKKLVGQMEGVWLTDNPQLPPMYSSYAEYRFEIALSTSDVRLVHWRSLLRERISRKQLANIDLETPDWKSFYFYFGNIEATNIRTADQYTSLARMRECRKAHFDKLAKRGIE
jgi:hypothetical protein